MIKREIIDQIKESTDIVQVIGEYLPLKPAGRNYRALCPFHSEKTPSFYVSPEKQIYHCFGCGASGSVITFIMEYEKITFLDAINKLASRLGIKIETETGMSENKQLYDACEFATQYYMQCLKKSPTAINYLKERKLSDETVEQFRIGYAPSGNALYNYAKKVNFSLDILTEVGLIVKKDANYTDWFYNRIIFPIFSPSGKVIGFSGRTIEENIEPKYINTPESAIFKKRESLYGFFQAKSFLYKNIPILVEGNFDVLTLAQNGFKSTIAPLGTALTPNQTSFLRRYSNKIYIAFDGDQAGKNATIRAIETLLSLDLEPMVVILPQDFDPDRFVKTYGKEKFHELLNNSYDYIDYVRYIQNNDKECLNELLRLTAMIKDPLLQEQAINKISHNFNITKDTLLLKIRHDKNYAPKSTGPVTSWKVQTIIMLERQILFSLLSNPQYLQIIQTELPETLIDSENIKKILQIFCETKDNPKISNIIDKLSDIELKKQLAELALENYPVLTLEEFKLKLYEYKIHKLQEHISKAEVDKNSQLAIKLAKELSETKKKVNEIRSRNYEK